jgi:RNA polymerase sigma-70 factor, ECF subfamily
MTVDDLYEDYESRLRAFARRLAHDPEDVEDLVQETFVRTLSHLQLLEQLGTRERRSWLFTTLRNLFYDRISSTRRRSELLGRVALETGSAVSTPPEDTGEGIFDLVPDGDRALLQMKYVEELNSREIAERLGIPAPTVRTRIHVAIKHLRAKRHRFADYLD